MRECLFFQRKSSHELRLLFMIGIFVGCFFSFLNCFDSLNRARIVAFFRIYQHAKRSDTNRYRLIYYVDGNRKRPGDTAAIVIVCVHDSRNPCKLNHFLRLIGHLLDSGGDVYTLGVRVSAEHLTNERDRRI